MQHCLQPRHCHFPWPYEAARHISPTILLRKRVRQTPTPPDAPERCGSCSTVEPETAEPAPFWPQSPAVSSRSAFPPRLRPPCDGSGPSRPSTTSHALVRLSALLWPGRPRPCRLLSRSSLPSRWSLLAPPASQLRRLSPAKQ